MATKLQVYNKALQLMGETRVSSTSEDVAQAYEMGVAWDTCVLDVFSAGYWNFATTTTSLSQSGSPIPGYSYRFSRPSDCLRIIQVSTTARFSDEADYRDEGSYLYGQVTTIYLRYVSSTLSVDGSISSWPVQFIEVLAARLAAECAFKITGSPTRHQAMWDLYDKRLVECMARDESNQARQHRTPTGGLAMQSAPAPAEQGAQ